MMIQNVKSPRSGGFDHTNTLHDHSVNPSILAALSLSDNSFLRRPRLLAWALGRPVVIDFRRFGKELWSFKVVRPNSSRCVHAGGTSLGRFVVTATPGKPPSLVVYGGHVEAALCFPEFSNIEGGGDK